MCASGCSGAPWPEVDASDYHPWEVLLYSVIFTLSLLTGVAHAF